VLRCYAHGMDGIIDHHVTCIGIRECVAAIRARSEARDA